MKRTDLHDMSYWLQHFFVWMSPDGQWNLKEYVTSSSKAVRTVMGVNNEDPWAGPGEAARRAAKQYLHGCCRHSRIGGVVVKHTKEGEEAIVLVKAHLGEFAVQLIKKGRRWTVVDEIDASEYYASGGL